MSPKTWGLWGGEFMFLMKGGMPTTYKWTQAKMGEIWGNSNYSSGTSLTPAALNENGNVDPMLAS